MTGTKVANVSASDTWQRLSEDSNAHIVDVRSRAEWAFVGQVDLSSLGKTPLLIEWQLFPDMAINPRFASDLSVELESLGAGKGTDVFFMCRSGVRSMAAAQAMADAGFEACHNVADGFEGPLDNKRHRGGLSGWKAAGLPWVQG